MLQRPSCKRSQSGGLLATNGTVVLWPSLAWGSPPHKGVQPTAVILEDRDLRLQQGPRANMSFWLWIAMTSWCFVGNGGMGWCWIVIIDHSPIPYTKHQWDDSRNQKRSSITMITMVSQIISWRHRQWIRRFVSGPTSHLVPDDQDALAALCWRSEGNPACQAAAARPIQSSCSGLNQVRKVEKGRPTNSFNLGLEGSLVTQQKHTDVTMNPAREVAVQLHEFLPWETKRLLVVCLTVWLYDCIYRIIMYHNVKLGQISPDWLMRRLPPTVLICYQNDISVSPPFDAQRLWIQAWHYFTRQDIYMYVYIYV